jgi:hypothetical protein
MPQTPSPVNPEFRRQADTDTIPESFLFPENIPQKSELFHSNSSKILSIPGSSEYFAPPFSCGHLTISFNYLIVFHPKTGVFHLLYRKKWSFDPVFRLFRMQFNVFPPEKYPFFINCQLTTVMFSGML